MSTVVLVAGAGLGAWAWSRVVPLLRAAGHDPRAVTLTGTGDRAHLNHPGLDVSAWVDDVVAHLETEELDGVVLVGHSFAGTVISGVAARAPERLAHLVYLDALVPSDGRSVFDDIGDDQAGLLQQMADAHDGWSLPWFTDAQLDLFYGGHGLSADDLTWMRRHVTAQPLATYRERLALGAPLARRVYVRCAGTPMPPPVTPETPGWDWHELQSGHWPMITAPRQTAVLLAELAAGADPAPRPPDGG